MLLFTESSRVLLGVWVWDCHSFVIVGTPPMTSNCIYASDRDLKAKTAAQECYATQKLCKQSFLDRLRENIGALNLEIRRDVPGDGNCFFSCVEDQFERIGLPATCASKLRSDLVNFLETVVSY